jgi:L-rhamnose isomerase
MLTHYGNHHEDHEHQRHDFGHGMSEFASASAETAAEHMAACAEVAKKVQMDTVDLMLTAGKDRASDAQETAEQATGDARAAVIRVAEPMLAFGVI